MAVTSQQIADAAGVSRGTVYRALNHTGRINPEVAENIRRIAREMGYQPNRAGRALAMSKRAAVIGVIIQAAETPFMEKVMEGILDAKGEVELLGADVIIRKIPDLNAKKAMEAMEELKNEGCNGIALVPVDDDGLKQMIDRFSDERIPVITFNSDIEESGRLCFVGQNAYQSGKTAAGLMAEMIPKDGKVLIISGYPSNRSHKNRTNGFMNELLSCRKDVKILDVQYAFDDSSMAERITGGMLNEYKDLSGIYLSASGVQGVCRVLKEKNLSGKVKVISNDLTDQNLRCLKEGSIQFLLGQDGYMQGYGPVRMLFDKLFEGKDPEKELNYTEIVIKTKYNV